MGRGTSAKADFERCLCINVTAFRKKYIIMRRRIRINFTEILCFFCLSRLPLRRSDGRYFGGICRPAIASSFRFRNMRVGSSRLPDYARRTVIISTPDDIGRNVAKSMRQKTSTVNKSFLPRNIASNSSTILRVPLTVRGIYSRALRIVSHQYATGGFVP